MINILQIQQEAEWMNEWMDGQKNMRMTETNCWKTECQNCVKTFLLCQGVVLRNNKVEHEHAWTRKLMDEWIDRWTNEWIGERITGCGKFQNSISFLF